MNGGEWFELSLLAGGNSLTGFAILLSLISGYMVIAYNVGEKLTASQVGLANAIYLGGCITMLYANFSNIRDAMMTRQQAMAAADGITIGSGLSPAAMASIFSISQSLFVLGSLIFMWQVRRGISN